MLKQCQRIYRIADGGIEELNNDEAEGLVRQQIDKGYTSRQEHSREEEGLAVAQMLYSAEARELKNDNDDNAGMTDGYIQNEKDWWSF